jgi:hypothetical protein
MTAERDEVYGPHLIGPDGCTTVEIMNGLGIRYLSFETPNGMASVDFDDPDFLSKLHDLGVANG